MTRRPISENFATSVLAVLAAAHKKMDALNYPPRNMTPPIDDRPREPSAP